jgi:zinc/manganese transport system substrate-binding protein
MKHLLAALFAFFLLANPAQAADKPLSVVTSFSVLGDMVRQVGGDAVVVKTLVGPDGDAHAYEPTPDDAESIAKADLVVVNGLHLEGWMTRLLASTKTKAKIVTASVGVAPREMVEENEGKVTDPHAWQDLSNGRIYVKNIAAALEEAAPDRAQEIEARAKAYDAKLAAMDSEVRAKLAAIPQEKRKIITSHDAFGYFGAAYGVKFMAPQGLSTESEASATDLESLIRQIKAEHIKTLFIENMTDPRLIQQIAKDTGAQMGGTLYSDALSPPSGPAPTYLDMFKNNLPKLIAGMK